MRELLSVNTWFSLRYADRQYGAESDQPPPRDTRLNTAKMPKNTVRDHLAGAGSDPYGIVQRSVRVFAVPVRAPLPHVAVHVIQAPGIRLLLAHRVRGPG